MVRQTLILHAGTIVDHRKLDDDFTTSTFDVLEEASLLDWSTSVLDMTTMELPESEKARPEGHSESILHPEVDPHDPLNWPTIHKIYIALLISLLGFTVQFGAALINPAFEQMSNNLNITVEQASYCTTVVILFGGIISLLAVPVANIYGRRITFVIAGIITAAGQFVSASVSSYGGVIAGRVLNGSGASVPLGLGAAVICDLFSQGDRGLYMGIYVLSVTNGQHVAPIAGGYVAERLGWRWCFWIPGIIQAGLWVVTVLTLPETLFSKAGARTKGLGSRSYLHNMLFRGRVVDRKLRARGFVASLRMAKYPAVLLPTI